MTTRRLFAALGALTLLVSVLATGCTVNSNPSPPADPNAWFTTTDRATGRTFRCQLWWQKSGYAGGLASWCYETTEASSVGP